MWQASVFILCASVLSVAPGLSQVAEWAMEDHVDHAHEAPVHVCGGDCHSSQSVDSLASAEPASVPVVSASSACSVRVLNDVAAARIGVTILVERPPAA